MSEQITAKIRKDDHAEAVEIALQKGQKIGIYISEAIRAQNERERMHLEWQAEQKKNEMYRRRMLGK